ncbi:hypothetical protein CDIK_0730 [Cucumispora dikerogammari]|nr:hypothetical protein CDIK_0730 [Cucumispora dikerogammari]
MNFLQKLRQIFYEPEKEFSSLQTLIPDLLIFNYINLSDTENSVGILGVDIKSRKELLLYRYDNKKSVYLKESVLKYEKDILFAQPYDFANNQKLSYLIISHSDGNNEKHTAPQVVDKTSTANPSPVDKTKDISADNYSIYFYDPEKKHKKLIEEHSSIIPIVFSYTGKGGSKNEIKFYYETKDGAYVCSLTGNNLVKKQNYKFGLSKTHSSAALSTKQDFKTVYCLETQTKSLIFCDSIIQKPNNKSSDFITQEIKLPVDNTEITGINFADLRGSSNMDLFFGYNSEQGPKIRVYLNESKYKTGDTTNIKRKKTYGEYTDITIPDSHGLSFITSPIISNGTNSNEPWYLKTNISANYIEGDAYPNLMFLLRNTLTNRTSLRIFTNLHKRTKNDPGIPNTVNYSDLQVNLPSDNLEHVFSISYIDLFNNQEELLIINTLENSSANINIAKKNFGKSNAHIKCAVVNGDVEKNQQIPIPGMSVQYKLHEKDIILRGNQSIKSAHLHLDPPFSHVGLGNVSTCVDQMIVGPFFHSDNNEAYKVIDKQLFPNSYLVLFIKEGKITIKQFINLTFTVAVVSYVFASVLVVNLIIFVVLAIREKIRIKNKSKKQVLSPIFESF